MDHELWRFDGFGQKTACSRGIGNVNNFLMNATDNVDVPF
jgi:hypothetical protein